MLENNWSDTVHQFWFIELTPKDWYQSSAELDQSIKQQFSPLLVDVSQLEPDSFGQDAKQLLSATIVLDQFPRNIHRGSADAFQYDKHAQTIANYAIQNELDQSLNKQERQFLYMPFMHAENIEMQNKSVELFATLHQEEGNKHAILHRDIVTQFGRFPHRNEVLGRPSTPDEIEYLKTAHRFGQ